MAGRITLSDDLGRVRRGRGGGCALGAVALLHPRFHGDGGRCAGRAHRRPGRTGLRPRQRSTGPQFVVQVAPNRVEVDEFNRWAAPLNDSIARAVAGDLAALLGTPDVATAPLANFNPAYRVTINVQRFESVSGEAR